jgi:hypothetical protein
MHGRRWFWMASQLDSANRPFFVAASNGPTNALGVQDGSYNQGGPVTNVIGVPVYLDLNIPTNLGAGTNEDRIIATRMRDHILFEGDLQLRALKEILSGTLGVASRRTPTARSPRPGSRPRRASSAAQA